MVALQRIHSDHINLVLDVQHSLMELLESARLNFCLDHLLVHSYIEVEQVNYIAHL